MSNGEKDDGSEEEESHATQRLVSDKAPLDFRSMETNFIYGWDVRCSSWGHGEAESLETCRGAVETRVHGVYECLRREDVQDYGVGVCFLLWDGGSGVRRREHELPEIHSSP